MISIQICKELYGASKAMELDIRLEIQEGSFLAVSGSSGAGKTTLLRVLAGLEDAQGSISVAGESWLDEKSKLSVQKRGIGFVFQEYALFENMTVLQNLLYVKKDLDLAEHLLKLTNMSELKERYPHALSGGQKQRVSLCRAMMSRPKLLLLDEPLSALDPFMRRKLQDEILTLHHEFKMTTIMVSHDPSEIYKLASRVIVLENGKIVNDGSAKEILLKTSGSQKFSFEGELLELKKIDVINVAVIAIGQQIVEVVVSDEESRGLEIGQKISVSTKAFSPILN